MKRKILLFASASALLLHSCKKEESTAPKNFEELKTRVIFNFADDVASKSFGNLNDAALKLKNALTNYDISTNEADFYIVRTNFLALRNAWELTSSMQFGPVATNDYINKLDTWPVNLGGIDAFRSAPGLPELADIEGLPNDQRGFHAMEYILYGVDGNRTHADISDRDRRTMEKLGQHFLKITQEIYTAWTVGKNSYYNEIVYTKNGSTTFKTNKDFFNTIVEGMKTNCKNLVNNNLGAPYNAIDSAAVESPFSNMSMKDILDNMASLKNVYNGRFKGSTGYGIKDVIKDKNSGLASKLDTRITAVDSALNAIKMPLDSAIYFKKTETKTAIDAIDSLRSTIENELKPFILQNITD